MTTDNPSHSPVPDGDESEADKRYILERLLARTSIAAQGQDAGLDDLLADLRAHLRGQRRDLAYLRSLQDQIDDQLERMDASRGEAVSAAPAPAPSAVVSAPPPRKGWMGRFFGHGKGSDKVAKRGAAPADTAVDLSVGTREEDLDQRLRIARRIAELLDTILAQVVLAPQAHARARFLREQLARDDDWEVLRGALNEAADLVIAAVSRGQKAFETFLQRLDERLALLRGHCSEQAAALEGRQSASASLEASLQDELTDLGSTLAAGDNLVSLRASVSGHIDSIAGKIRQFREQETERESALAGQVAAMTEKLVVMETHCEQVREELQQERARTLTDVLTGLPNREAWDERLGFEHDRWQRYRQPVSVCVLDIDLFKRVNDTYGHRAGDRVLQMVARTLQEQMRTTDFIARYGGEEFVMLLPETPAQTAAAVVDKLRAHVAELPFHFQGQPVAITFSAGIAGFAGEVDADVVFDRADRALYAAKNAGRNQCQLAPEEASR